MGYLQEQIIKIGKEKGFVTSSDISKFYQPSKVQQEMNKLIAQDYFTVSLLIIFFIPLIVFIIGAVSFAKDNLYIAVIIAFMIQLFLIILTILGFLPYLFPIV